MVIFSFIYCIPWTNSAYYLSNGLIPKKFVDTT